MRTRFDISAAAWRIPLRTLTAEERIAVFHGPTPLDKREAIKLAFNEHPSKNPLRILLCNDAAREGLNLQAHCFNLFHFDVPWNPSRLEQRNGRIDRKLQPSDTVYCRYFVYTQRLEDRVLRALVRKTETIRAELGSLSQVIALAFVPPAHGKPLFPSVTRPANRLWIPRTSCLGIGISSWLLIYSFDIGTKWEKIGPKINFVEMSL
jgi:hypothetical protein